MTEFIHSTAVVRELVRTLYPSQDQDAHDRSSGHNHWKCGDGGSDDEHQWECKSKQDTDGVDRSEAT